jgi:hypothetical protein
MRPGFIRGCSALLLVLATGSWALAQPEKPKQETPLRIAVFNLDAVEGFAIDSKALTDQVTTILSAIENVELIERADLAKGAEELRIGLSGLVESGSAVKLGKFVSAQFVLVGRASRIGQNNYIVLKLIDVETTVQKTVSTKGTAEEGSEPLVTRLETSLKDAVSKLKRTPDADDVSLAELKKAIKPLSGKVFLVDVSEEHVSRPLQDPAAQVAIANRLKALGLMVVLPKDPVAGWKQRLLEAGKYGEKHIDYLVEGEGLSGLAGQVQGLTTCRARVELRIVSVPGRAVDVTDKGVGAGVDLVEALAAKTALEEGGKQACDATLKRLLEELDK